ncbi:MAG: hypothetical protein PHC62_07245 [Candidatus Izemoplasmatales bacterium]|nr:hypothetical protein [Candidatus Izemoplasmatales bacterium]
MKNKVVIVIMLLMFITLTGCTSTNTDNEFDLSGEYVYGDCIYLSFFSSSTLESQTLQHKNIYYLNFSDTSMLYYSEDNELDVSYENVNYVSVEKDQNISDILTLNLYGLNMEEFLDSIEYRYDIYRNNLMIGFTIFQGDSHTYIAYTGMGGSSKDIFNIWSIFEIEKTN